MEELIVRARLATRSSPPHQVFCPEALSFKSRLSYVEYVVVCFLKTLKYRGAKSARSPQSTLLALLAPHWLAYLEKSRALLSPTHHTRESFFLLPVCISKFFTSIIYGHILRM